MAAMQFMNGNFMDVYRTLSKMVTSAENSYIVVNNVICQRIEVR